MKRIVALLVAASMVFVFILSGCGTESNSKQGKEVNEPKKEAVTLKFWKAGNDVAWHDYWLKTVEEYETQNEDVTIEFTEAPWGQEIDTKLNAAFASGTAPDIIGHAIISLAQRVDMKQYAPLDEYINKWEEKDDVLEKVYDLGEYKEKIYGLGIYPSASLLVYRKDYFKEAGLDPEQPPNTWEELADYAVKLTKRDGDIVTRSGFVLPIDGFKLLIPFVVQNGANHVSKDGQPVFDDALTVETLQYFTDLFKDKKVSAEVIQKQENQQSLFVQGKAAMSLVQSSWIAKMLKDDPSLKDKIGFFTISREKEAIWGGCEFLYMSSESKHKEAVWNFMKFAMSKEQTWERYEATKCPVIRKSLQEKYIQNDPYLNEPIWNANLIGIGAPKVSWATLYMKKYIPQAQQEAFYGKKTPEQALKDNLQLLKDEIAVAK